MRERIVAAIFAIFFGSFGVQFFYLDRIFWGVFSILFCWTGIPSIVGIVQGIMLLLSTDEEFDAKYNPGKSSRADTHRYDSLEKIHSLKEKGILSEAQYEEEKQRLLNR